MMLSPETVMLSFIGVRFGKAISQPAVSAEASRVKVVRTLSEVAPMVCISQVPATAARSIGAGATGAGGSATVSGGASSFLAQPITTAVLRTSIRRRMVFSVGGARAGTRPGPSTRRQGHGVAGLLRSRSTAMVNFRSGSVNHWS